MVNVGYTLMCEQTGPKELVDHAVRAEAAAVWAPEELLPRLREL